MKSELTSPLRAEMESNSRAPQNQTKSVPIANPFTAADVAAILRQRSWLGAKHSSETEAWLADAAALLGTHAADPSTSLDASRAALENLLSLIFCYDARALLEQEENQAVMARQGAREVIRELANRILDGEEMDSDSFKAIIAGLKATLHFRGRELFHPIRLALAGRTGEGELDRVVLLLDTAAKLPFLARVKGTRERMLEFCAALD